MVGTVGGRAAVVRAGGRPHRRTVKAFLAGRGPFDLRPLMRYWDIVSYPTWTHANEAFRTRRGVRPELDKAQTEAYESGVALVTAETAADLAAAYDFGRHRRLLDVGGGYGTFVKPILGAYEHLTATLVDLPDVAAVVAQQAAAGPFPTRLTAVAADVFAGPVRRRQVPHDQRWRPLPGGRGRALARRDRLAVRRPAAATAALRPHPGRAGLRAAGRGQPVVMACSWPYSAWMQPREPARLRRSAAQAILSGVIPEFRVTGVVVRGGGEVNAVYEVRGAGGARPLIIKIYPERWPAQADRWRSKLAKEVYVYRLLARHGIREIPRVLHHEAAGVPDLPSAFAVMTMLDGHPLSTVGDRLAERHVGPLYHEMGRLLATVHQITADRWGYVATGIVDSKPSNTAYMLDQFAIKLGRFGDLGGGSALATAIGRYVGRHADLFAECSQPALCHNDFHDGNVLVRETELGWQVVGYVDVENTVVADPLLDLAKTDYYALRENPAKRSAFLGGYGPLPPGWAARLALYRLHHALEFWNWSASTGKRSHLAGIRADLEKMISGDPA